MKTADYREATQRIIQLRKEMRPHLLVGALRRLAVQLRRTDQSFRHLGEVCHTTGRHWK